MPRRSVALLALLFGATFLISGLLYVTLPLASFIAERFSVSLDQTPLVSTMFGLPYAVGFLIWGPLSDRIGRERVLLPGLLVTALATVLVALSRDFTTLIAARMAQGLAASTVPPIALAIAGERLPPRHRALGIAVISLSFMSAAPLAQLYGATIRRLDDIMFSLAPGFLIAAACAIAVLRTGQDRQPMSDLAAAGQRIAVHRQLLPNAAWACAATILFSYVVFQSGLQLFETKLPMTMALVQGVSLPATILSLAASPLITRWGAVRTAQIGIAGLVLGLIVASIGSLAAVLTGAIMLTAGVAIAAPGLIATLILHAHQTERGLAIAIYAFVLYVGASLAPLCAAPLARGGFALLCLSPALVAAGALCSLIWTGSRSQRRAHVLTGAPDVRAMPPLRSPDPSNTRDPRENLSCR